MSDQLLKMQERFWEAKISNDPKYLSDLLDYGCGYGALLDYLIMHRFSLSKYIGFDISETMLKHARALHGDHSNTIFTNELDQIIPVDYVIASGVFNLKLDVDERAWQEYVLSTLER